MLVPARTIFTVIVLHDIGSSGQILAESILNWRDVDGNPVEFYCPTVKWVFPNGVNPQHSVFTGRHTYQ
jgi:hypothetical protein